MTHSYFQCHDELVKVLNQQYVTGSNDMQILGNNNYTQENVSKGDNL